MKEETGFKIVYYLILTVLALIAILVAVVVLTHVDASVPADWFDSSGNFHWSD